MTKDEALKMAIEAMTLPNNLSFLMAITACKDALEQPAQEPVAMYENGNVNWINTPKDNLPLYTHPAPSWRGLSDDEKLAIIRKWKDAHTMRAQELIGLGDAIEQALKEKNL
jgi:hypothetical protein